MQLRIGSYSFASNSVGVTMRATLLANARGIPYAQSWVATVEGYLTADTSAACTFAAEALEAALVPYKDFALYDDNGAITHLNLLNAGSTTGVIPSNLAFPNGKGAELVTFVTFRFEVRAEYPAAGSQTILQSWHESISVVGTGGPKFVLRPALAGPPQKQITQQQTIIRATQSGQAVGYLARPTPPNPLWPFAEQENQRRIEQGSPKFMGKQFQDFGVSWSYAFESAVSLIGPPNAR